MGAWEEKDCIAKLEEGDEASTTATSTLERVCVCVCGKLPLESSIFPILEGQE